MGPSATRIGREPQSRPEAAVSGSGSSWAPLRWIQASECKSDDAKHIPYLAVSPPTSRTGDEMTSDDRQNEARQEHGVDHVSPHDHSGHSAEQERASDTSNSNGQRWLLDNVRTSHGCPTRAGFNFQRLAHRIHPWYGALSRVARSVRPCEGHCIRLKVTLERNHCSARISEKSWEKVHLVVVKKRPGSKSEWVRE